MGLVTSLLLIAAGLAAGVVLGRILRPRLKPEAFEALRRGLQVAALLVINPFAFLGALWALPTVDARLTLLPVVGLATLAGAFGLGALAARWAGLDAERALLFRTGVSFTNIGNVGGLTVFLLVGETGFAVLPLYKLFEELWMYGVLFPHTRVGAERLRASAPTGEPGSPIQALVKVTRDPFVVVALVSVALGLGLHFSGWSRPAWYGPLNGWLVPVSSVCLLISIGLGLKLSVSARDLKPALGMTALKIFALPVLSLALTGLAGFWSVPEVWKTALILSAMPMAFLSLIPPQLYGLDEKFSATAWAATMLSLGITLPVLGWVVAVF